MNKAVIECTNLLLKGWKEFNYSYYRGFFPSNTTFIIYKTGTNFECICFNHKYCFYVELHYFKLYRLNLDKRFCLKRDRMNILSNKTVKNYIISLSILI